MPRILWRDSGSGLEARQRKARHGLLYSLLPPTHPTRVFWTGGRYCVNTRWLPMGSRRKVPRYRNPSAAHEAKATLYAKPRDPINPVLSSDRVEMSPPKIRGAIANRTTGPRCMVGAEHVVDRAAGARRAPPPRCRAAWHPRPGSASCSPSRRCLPRCLAAAGSARRREAARTSWTASSTVCATTGSACATQRGPATRTAPRWRFSRQR